MGMHDGELEGTHAYFYSDRIRCDCRKLIVFVGILEGGTALTIKTYPEMNKKIVEYLRGSEINFAIYAAQRIEELEETAKELIVVMDELKKRGDWLKRDCTEPDKVMLYAIDITVMGNGTLSKAKGVLGDE